MVDHGALVVDHGALVVDHGALVVDHGALVVDHGALVVDHGVLVVDHGALVVRLISIYLLSSEFPCTVHKTQKLSINVVCQTMLFVIGASAASPYLVNPTPTLSVCLYISWTGSILASKVDALYRVDCYVRVKLAS